MKRLSICAFGAIVITFSTALADDLSVATAKDEAVRTVGLMSDDAPVLLGQDKVQPLCPAFCVPERITSLKDATVGEREVMNYALALAAIGQKTHIGSHRSLWAQVEKFPSLAAPEEAPTLVTQDEFRPALDPVLAEPTTTTTE